MVGPRPSERLINPQETPLYFPVKSGQKLINFLKHEYGNERQKKRKLTNKKEGRKKELIMDIQRESVIIKEWDE